MIGSSENRISYNGNGIATEFAYTFKILEKSDIKVLHVAADGTETVLTKDYYVDMEKSVVLYPGYAPGAEIPEQNRPPVLPVGERLVIYREVPITQDSALDKHWPFNVIEDGLDKLTIICQQIWDRLQRSFYVSESTSTNFDPKVPIEAGKTFRVKDDGTGFEVTEDPGKVIDGATALLKQTTEQANIALESSTNAQNAANSVKKYKALWFDSVAAMKAEPSLTAGAYVCTAGYYEANDGGSASYLIREKLEADIDDGGSLHELTNGLVAELLVENGTVNVKQFGAKGDGNRDETNIIKIAIQNAAKLNAYVFFPNGTYLISEIITVRQSGLKGENVGGTIIKAIDDAYINSSWSNIENLTLNANNVAKFGLRIIGGDHQKYSNIKIHDALEDGLYVVSTQYGWSENSLFNHILIERSGHNAIHLEVSEDYGFINESVFSQCEVRGVSLRGNGYNAIRVDGNGRGEISSTHFIDCSFDAKRKYANDNGYEIGEIVRLQKGDDVEQFSCYGWSFIGGGWETTLNYPFYGVDCFKAVGGVNTNAWFISSQVLGGWGNLKVTDINAIWYYMEAVNIYNNINIKGKNAWFDNVPNKYTFEGTTNETRALPIMIKRTTSSFKIKLILIYKEWAGDSKTNYQEHNYVGAVDFTGVYIQEISDAIKIFPWGSNSEFTISPTVELTEDNYVVNFNVVPPTIFGTGGRGTNYSVKIYIYD